MSIVEDRPTSPAPDGPEPPPVATEARLEELERDVERYRVSRDSWTWLIFGLAGLAILAAVFAIVVALTRDSDEGGAAASGDASAAAAAQPITAELSEFDIELSTNQVEAAGILTINNTGSQIHNVSVVGTELISEDIPGGSSGQLDLSSLGGPALVAMRQRVKGCLAHRPMALKHQQQVLVEPPQRQALKLVPKRRVPAQQARPIGCAPNLGIIEQRVPGRQEGIEQHWAPPGYG